MAGIIKAGGRISADNSGTGVAYQFDDMGNAYLAKIKAEAAAIVAQARDEAARVKASAVEEGRKAGLQAAEASFKTKVEQQLQSISAALDQAVQTIVASRQAWQKHWEQHALHVAAAIAARIARREIANTPAIALDLIREALELAAGNEHVVLRLNPADHAAMSGQLAQLTARLGKLAPAEIVADGSIAAGGSRVDTEFGSIDQQIETQLARILAELS
jgi:flagellar assembly protein FliH